MADKYLDPTAYRHAATITGSASAGTLTVSAVASGVVGIGAARVTGAGVPDNTYIVAAGTGIGGTGTYTLRIIDPNAPAVSAAVTFGSTTLTVSGGYPVNGRDAPFGWGVPLDGDGSVSTPSTASALAVVNFASATFVSGSSSVSVMGATALTVSGSANSATNVQYSATLTTMLNNIVTVINTLATALTVNIPTNWSAVQVRAAVFARRVGNTIELMTNSGSAAWNGLTAMAFSNVTGASAASWSGGVGGCWGYFVNPRTLFTYQAFTPAAYGSLNNVALAGSFEGGDRVIHRGGVVTVDAGSSGMAPTFTAVGATANNPLRFLIDDGTVWGDPAPRVLRMVNMGRAFSIGGPSAYSIEADSDGEGAIGLVLDAINVPYGYTISPSSVGGALDCVALRAIDGSPVTFGPVVGLPENVRGVFSRGLVLMPAQTAQLFGGPSGSTSSLDWSLSGTTVSAQGASGPNESLLPMIGTGSRYRITLDSCRFENFVAGSKLFPDPYGSVAKTQIIARNVEWGNISSRGPAMANNASGSFQNMFASSSQFGNNDFALDTPEGYCDWNSLLSFPYLSATLRNGVTPWSVRLIQTREASRSNRFVPFETPRFGKINSLSTAVRTLTLQLLAHEALTVNAAVISLLIDYQDDTGVFRTVDTFDQGASPLAASTATWAPLVSGQVTFVSAVTQYLNRHQITVTTQHPIMTGTEVGFRVRMTGSVDAAHKMFFIDPDLTIA